LDINIAASRRLDEPWERSLRGLFQPAKLKPANLILDVGKVRMASRY